MINYELVVGGGRQRFLGRLIRLVFQLLLLCESLRLLRLLRRLLWLLLLLDRIVRNCMLVHLVGDLDENLLRNLLSLLLLLLWGLLLLELRSNLRDELLGLLQELLLLVDLLLYLLLVIGKDVELRLLLLLRWLGCLDLGHLLLLGLNRGHLRHLSLQLRHLSLKLGHLLRVWCMLGQLRQHFEGVLSFRFYFTHHDFQFHVQISCLFSVVALRLLYKLLHFLILILLQTRLSFLSLSSAAG